MAANKVPGVRAALCNDLYTARMSRLHNDANVLAMGGRIVGLRPRRRDRHAVAERRRSKADDISDGSIRLPHIERAGAAATRDRVPEDDITDDDQPRPRPAGARWPRPTPRSPTPSPTSVHRQNSGLELIASENFVSQAVLEAAGSVLTNKYAEGYPGKRYYGGCEFVDVAESLAIARAKELFGAEHANVQPHSGAQANMAVYLHAAQARRHGARHEPRPRRPPHARTSAQLLRQALQHRPLRRAPGRRADRLRRARAPRARAQAEDDHGRRERLSAGHRLRAASARSAATSAAPIVTDMAHIAGLVAAKVHPSPVPHSDFVTTTTHKTLRGPRGGMVLCRSAVRQGPRPTRSSPASRAGRSCTSSRPRPCASRKRWSRRLPTTRSRSSPTRKRLAAGLSGGRLPAGQRRHRQSPDARRRVLEGADRQGRRGGARQGRDHRQQERDSRSIRTRRWSRAASASARRRSRAAACAKPEMDLDRRVHRARARRPGRRRRRSPPCATKSRLCAGSSRCTQSRGADRRRRRAAFAAGWSAGASARRVRAARRAARNGRGRRRRPRDGRRAPRRSRHRHRQDARLPRPGDPQPPARARLDRHQEPPGTDLLQGPAGAARSARHPVHGHLHEGARQLPLPAPVRGASARRAPIRSWDETLHIRILERVAAETETGDRAEIEDLPEDLPFWSDIAATTENCLGAECPRYSDCFVDADAPARRRIRHRHRQPPPALRRRRRAAERLRRSDSALQLRDRRRGAPARRRGDAVLRPRRSATTASTTSSATSTAPSARGSMPDGERRDQINADVRRIRDDARRFFSALQMLRFDGPAARGSETRVRVEAIASRAARRRWRGLERGVRGARSGHRARAKDVPEDVLALGRRAAEAARTICGSCSAPTTPATCTSSRRAAGASSCGHRRSTSRRSSGTCCSTGWTRRC